MQHRRNKRCCVCFSVLTVGIQWRLGRHRSPPSPSIFATSIPPSSHAGIGVVRSARGRKGGTVDCALGGPFHSPFSPIFLFLPLLIKHPFSLPPPHSHRLSIISSLLPFFSPHPCVRILRGCGGLLPSLDVIDRRRRRRAIGQKEEEIEREPIPLQARDPCDREKKIALWKGRGRRTSLINRQDKENDTTSFSYESIYVQIV